MKTLLVLAALAAAAPLAATADDADGPYRFADQWPTHYVFGDGTDLGLSLKYQYDVDRFDNDEGRFEDAQTNRRKELGFYLKKKNRYDLVAAYDFQSYAWLDVYLRLQSKGLLGRDIGALRIGQSKTPVGFEGNTSTGATTFLEGALPTQAVYANRRIGVDWALIRPHYLVQAGYYRGDLNGDNDGHTLAARLAWVPQNKPGHVLHLGLSASREWLQGSTDGRGTYHSPSARLRARPEAALLPDRLVDSGSLAFAGAIDRRGAEALWIDGPWSAQGEYLDATVQRLDGQPDVHAHGYYAFATWVATGESRGYAAGNVADLRPAGRYGALELALRYSQLDLDDAPTLGGRERNWTAGINWYLNRYLKLQANYVHFLAHRRGDRTDGDVAEVRAQVQF